MYSLYGLRIRSAIRLPCPELEGSGQRADVELVEASRDQLRESCNSAIADSDKDGYWDCHRYENGAIQASWGDLFEFVVLAGGAKVLWRRMVDVDDEVLFTYLLNQVMSDCLAARGVEPLHGTAIVVDGAAIALLGDSGYGKSTLAAALMRRGCRLLTDDMLVLNIMGRQAIAHPSLARLKLNPDSADAFFDGRRSLPMNPFTTKMILPLGASEHVARPVALRAMFAIQPASDTNRISIRHAEGRLPMLALVRSAFNTTLLTQARLERQFRFASRVAMAVPIRILTYPRQLELLPEVADRILAEVSRETETN